MNASTSYWEKIPLWSSESPEQSFETTSDTITGEINPASKKATL